jgi:hypothetical protein
MMLRPGASQNASYQNAVTMRRDRDQAKCAGGRLARGGQSVARQRERA